MQDIILLHGAIGAADQLLPLSKSLSSKGFKVHTLCFSGHGKLSFNEEFSINQFAVELYQFIIEKNLIKPSVFGYSMGGYIALYLAAQKPNLMGKIITLATKFDWTPEGAFKEAGMLNPDVLQHKVPQFAEVLQNRHGEKWKELLHMTAKMMKLLGQNPLLSEALIKSVENPVMLGLGDKDNMVRLEETRTIFGLLKNPSMFMLPNTKHPIEGVDVELLSMLLDGFLKAR